MRLNWPTRLSSRALIAGSVFWAVSVFAFVIIFEPYGSFEYVDDGVYGHVFTIIITPPLLAWFGHYLWQKVMEPQSLLQDASMVIASDAQRLEFVRENKPDKNPIRTQQNDLGGSDTTNRTGKKLGIILIKLLLTSVALIFAAGLGGTASKAISGERFGSVSMAFIFMACMIIPIWYGAPIRWRLFAAGAGIAGGIFIWLISLFIVSSDIVLNSQLIGFFRAGAPLISLAICIGAIRAGRSRRASNLISK